MGGKERIHRAANPWGHTEYLLKLPPLHKDPFDRLLVAQAMAEADEIDHCR